MAEFELQVKYSTPVTGAILHATALTFPIWGVAVPISFVLFLLLLLRLPANISWSYALSIIGVMLAVTGTGTIAAVLCDDNTIRVSKDGLLFPARFLPGLRFKNERRWSELSRVRLQWKRQNQFDDSETLTLVFADGGFLTLKLKHLPLDKLEQFFIAFEACAYSCERDADLADFEKAVQTKRPGLTLSETELWERSLSQRYSSTTFVPLEPGYRLQSGRFNIAKQLGFGGFSAVYLANPQDGGFVVIKEASFPTEDDGGSRAAEMFQKESSLLSRLDHPNINKISDYFLENQRHYMVLQHVAGIDLQRLIMEQGPQPAEKVAQWVLQMAQALSYLHSLEPPVVHRDVTPDNTILRPSGAVVLVDFGAAKEIAGEFTGTIMGKQAYMAPEQFKGKPSPKSDIYSLGCTMHYLLTGKAPEPLTTSNPNDCAPSVPSFLSELVERCTATAESERPTAEELLQLLTADTFSTSVQPS